MRHLLTCLWYAGTFKCVEMLVKRFLKKEFGKFQFTSTWTCERTRRIYISHGISLSVRPAPCWVRQPTHVPSIYGPSGQYLKHCQRDLICWDLDQMSGATPDRSRHQLHLMYWLLRCLSAGLYLPAWEMRQNILIIG